jgi:hypothetical protein
LAQQSHACIHPGSRVVRTGRREADIAADFSSLFADRQIAPERVAKDEQVARLLELAELARVIGARITGGAVERRSGVSEGSRVRPSSRGVGGVSTRVLFVERTETDV